MKNEKTKLKPVIFIYLVIAMLFISYTAGILPFGLFLSLIIYSGLYLIIVKERKTVKIVIDLIILNFLITYENLSQLIKRNLMLVSRSLLFLKIIIFLDYRLPTVLNILYKKAYVFVYSVLLFLSVKLPKQIRRTVKLILKTIVYSAIYFIELVVPLILKSAFVIKSTAIKLFNLIDYFISQLSSIFSYLTAIYLSKKASLTRFAGIAVFVLIILFFFIGVNPGEETIKFVGAVGEACTYNDECTALGSYACDAESGLITEPREGKTTDDLLCFNKVACYGGSPFCGSQDGHCQADAGASSNCDDYPEMSSIASVDPGYPGYCDSNCAYHSTIGTYKFYVKNSAGTNRASFDDVGNVVITGTLYKNGAVSPAGNDDFIIKNSAGTNVAYIDGATGNMYLAGGMWDAQPSVTPPANSFIIKNSAGTNVAYIDGSGNLKLIGAFVQLGTP